MDKQTNDEPPLSFPKTLEGFGYAFNEQGQMRHVETGEAFVFKVREDDRNWNQKRYEALGEVLNQHVFELLEKKCNMTRVMVPVDATENEPSSFIFLSPDALTNPSKLLVLIQGSGVVRAGQWARRLIINEDLDSGTQIPFIARAMEEGYGVMVLNPNENSVEVDMPTPSSLVPLSQSEPSDGQAEKDMPTPSSLLPLSQSEPSDGQAEKDMPTPSSLLPLSQSEPSDGQAEKRDKAFDKQHCNSDKERETKQIQIRENSSSQEHVLYVWDHFVSRAQAKDVFIVAHSYGGLSLVDLMKRREAELKSRVVAVAFTDSVHNIRLQKPNQGVQNWMQKHCRNWVRSEEPLDTRMRTNWPDCPCVSAGTDEHELTSWRSFQSIFRFFNKAPRKEDRRR